MNNLADYFVTVKTGNDIKTLNSGKIYVYNKK